MRIEHLAIWTRDLEGMKEFYLKFFDLTAGEKYVNPKKNFSSYFLSFENGARLELMHRPEISNEVLHPAIGITHFAIGVGSKDKVDQMTEEFRRDGIEIVGEPRTTGDGYYESVILDPEGNLVELTI